MKMSIRKFLLSLTLLVPALQQTACADNVTYLYRSWDESTKTVKTETKTADATPLRSVAKDGEWMGLGDGWYYMEGERINIQTLNILGTDVHLILGDGTIFECYGGIKLEEGHKLTIYGQSEGDGAGFLWAHQGTDTYKGYKNASGIGGGEAAFIGTLEIHGGRINADGGAYGAGIGHGAFDSKSKTKYTGKIIVYGGTINATGGQSGAGIGSGSGHYDDANDSPEYIQYGGTVTCTGGETAAGLGGGGGFYKIWGNEAAQGGQIWKATINGGTLTAKGGRHGAGIGSGNQGKKGGEIIINGGTVTATGGFAGAGIGGGYNSYSPVITINGGNVKTYGKAAGIGTGYYGTPAEFNMYGGTVYAEGVFESAGVGGGKNSYGGKISIFGGTLEAVSGQLSDNVYRAFGSGYLKDNNDFQDTEPGSEHRRNFLYLGDETHFVKVRIGNSKTELGTQYSLAANRKNDCRTHFHAKVETCNHDDDGALSYTQVDDEKHRKYCKYCGYQNDEAHNYVDGKCVCGKEGNNEPETWTVTIYQATSSSSTAYGDGKEYKVLKGQQFPVPAPDAIEGLTFMQWKQNPASAPENIEMKDADIAAGAPAALEITPTADVTLYAQYRYDYNEEWTWAADHSSATVTLKQGNVVVKSNIAATVTTEEKDATASENGYKRYTATAAWEKATGITYQFTDVFETTYVNSLTLQDNADNDDLIWQNHDTQVHEVELSGRTIYRDGKWNTLVLPFDIDDLSVTDLGWSDLDLRTLSASSYDATTKTLKLTFTKATKIEAGKPYIIRSENEHAGFIELPNPTFRNVTINATDNSVQTDVVDFIGTYSAIELDASMTDVLYLGKNNTLRWPKGNTTLKSCRAAFVLKGAAVDADAAATRVVIDFGDGEVTGIETLERIPVLTGEDSNVFYTLGGRRMTGSQLPRGIYINKGKKVIIK